VKALRGNPTVAHSPKVIPGMKQLVGKRRHADARHRGHNAAPMVHRNSFPSRQKFNAKVVADEACRF
jgi:hypothetical protein